MSGFASKNTYSFTDPSTTSKSFGLSTSQTTPFQTKSSGNLFQSSSTTAFQPSTSGNMFRPQQSTNSWAPSTTTTNPFQTQPPAQQPPTCAMSGFQMPSTTTNLFQTASTQPPAQQPAPQSGFQVPSTTTNRFQTQPSAPTTFTQQDLENHLATCSVAATTPDATEVAQREKEVTMWTPNVHRDIYNILLNPYLLNIKYKGDQDAGAVLVAKQMSSFAFVDKVNLKGVTMPAEWTILSDELLLNAIDHIGEVTAMALALLKAFEKYLETKVKKWTGVDVANLSIEFLFCFGSELTPKFDLNHRLRTRQCTLSEQILQTAPYTQFVSSVIVKRYQKWDVSG